jgi:cytochrome c oxidase subunit 4
MGGSHADIDKHVRAYIGVFISLAVLTAVTVGASYIHFGSHSTNIVVGMLIAAIKAGLVASVFMHLKWEKKIIYWVLLICFVLFAALMALPGLTVGGSMRVGG